MRGGVLRGEEVISLVSAIVQFVDFGSKVLNRLNEFKSDTQKQAGHFYDTTANALKPVVDGCLEQVKDACLLSRVLPTTTMFSRLVPC